MRYLVNLGGRHLHLVNSKCLPILLYCLEVCPLNKSDLRSLDFTVTRLLMKLFRTSNRDIINECCSHFCFKLPSEILPVSVLCAVITMELYYKKANFFVVFDVVNVHNYIMSLFPKGSKYTKYKQKIATADRNPVQRPNRPLSPSHPLPCDDCTDIDECATDNGGCSASACCSNTVASFTCTCLPGYTGDGFDCAG